MRKWNSEEEDDRKNAAYAFCKMLDQNENEGLRKACQEDKDFAWDTLRKTGDFEDMPHGVEVLVFESTIDSNDMVVSMILPKQGEVGPLDPFDWAKVWRCSWADPDKMSKWKPDDGRAARKIATYEFCQALDQDSKLREACKSDPHIAWDGLRAAGQFVDMPHAVKLCVLEDDSITANNKMVTMVLPEKGQVKPFETFSAAEVWRCTWAHYVARSLR